MILLTDGELLDIYEPHLWEEGNTWREVGHWVSKAQLKKVVEWLDGEYKYLAMSPETFRLFESIRRALLKECE